MLFRIGAACSLYWVVSRLIVTECHLLGKLPILYPVTLGPPVLCAPNNNNDNTMLVALRVVVGATYGMSGQ